MGLPRHLQQIDQTREVLFWSLRPKLYDLFWGLHNMKEQKPEDVVAMAAEYNIHFLRRRRERSSCRVAKGALRRATIYPPAS